MAELSSGEGWAVLEHEHEHGGGKVYTYLASNKNSLKKDAEGLLTKENFSLCCSSLCRPEPPNSGFTSLQLN